MAIDPSNFHKSNVIDTCSIWNILSSKLLYATAISIGCSFCCTRFVYYECLHKPRKSYKEADIELQNRLRKEYENGKFKSYDLDIQDLQDVEILRKRMNISKGELTSIAFAKKTRQAFLTDDQKARKLASEVMECNRVQTIPHLLGWLLFVNYLNDNDMHNIINEHKQLERPLEKYFLEVYEMVLEFKLKI